MFSRGSLNGSSFNRYPVNAGAVVLDDLQATAVFLFGQDAGVSLRPALAVASAMKLAGDGVPVRRMKIGGQTVLPLSALPSLSMRFSLRGSPLATVTDQLSAVMRIRPALASASSIQTTALASLMYRYLRPTNLKRRLHIERRQPRTISREDRCVAVPVEARRAYVPLDREH